VAEAGLRAAAITFAGPRLLAAFERELDLELPVLGDPRRALYAAFGFRRASVARVWLDPRSVAHDLSLRVRGGPSRPRLPAQDTLQLGGDVVLDAAGRVRWIYASRGPEDRPSVEAMISAMLSCR
jgi:hypothetical protein